MNVFSQFFRYYEAYLGCKGLPSLPLTALWPCEQRNRPLNSIFLQYLIVAKWKGSLIFSVAPQFYQEFSSHNYSLYEDIKDERLIKDLQNFFSHRLTNYKLRYMKRLTVNVRLVVPRSTAARPLTLDDRNIFLNTGQRAYEKNYKKQKWQEKAQAVKEGRIFACVNEREIIAWAEVSDIDYNGGNIVVMTTPAYRNLGYGRLVTSAAARWCLERQIVPVYWVDSLNVPSLRIAQRIGFRVMSEELVISVQTGCC